MIYFMQSGTIRQKALKPPLGVLSFPLYPCGRNISHLGGNLEGTT